MITTGLGPIKAQTGRPAPLELWLYSVFALAVTVADLVVVFACPVEFRARLVPLTGWLASLPYMFSFFFGFLLIFSGNASRVTLPAARRRAMRHGITALLLLGISSGVFNISKMGSETFGNPWLTISPWQPIWTILIPAIWIAILHSPRMNQFCRETQESKAFRQPASRPSGTCTR